MLKNINIIYQNELQKNASNGVTFKESDYITEHAKSKLLELRLYILIKQSVIEFHDISDFETKALATRLNTSPASINNAKSSLKSMGILKIIFFKDERNKPMVRVVIGLKANELYDLGFTHRITRYKEFLEVENKIKNCPKNKLKDLIIELNQEYENKSLKK